MGVDIHMVTIPPSPAPVPMPHPFIGIVMDPMDYLPMVGTMIQINKQKRSNAGTTATLGTVKHIPMGAGFHPGFMPRIAHEGIQFFGSLTVKTDGTFLSAATFNMMTCSCIGVPLGTAELYMPVTTTIPIPGGFPVMVGGPQVPDLAGIVMKAIMAGGMKFALKKAGKLFKKKKIKSKAGCGC